MLRPSFLAELRNTHLVTYSQISGEQRYQIYVLLKAEHTLTLIAEVMGKHNSTISRKFRVTPVAVTIARYRHSRFVIRKTP